MRRAGMTGTDSCEVGDAFRYGLTTPVTRAAIAPALEGCVGAWPPKIATALTLRRIKVRLVWELRRIG